MERQNEISDYDIVYSDDTHEDSKSSAALMLDLSGVAKGSSCGLISACSVATR